ncbi:lamin tail domain-containing protein [Kaistella sp.]|uniref:lamin tail domain-containing protein n=1 Tax=Kaistella sp. TaxID=2782235 RepID=UPI003C3E30D2
MITEVYYNTPYNEKLYFQKKEDGAVLGELVHANKHHRGEFIEIYNFSDKDINLKNWYLKDLLGTFWFPEKIIKSRQFLVIAYSTLPYNTTPFSEYFTTTKGKENQIILQDKIILRNKKEKIDLGYTLNDGLNLIEKSSYQWNYAVEPQSNFIKDIWQTPNLFYAVNSIQYNPSTPPFVNYKSVPNPLDAEYKPEMQSYDQLVKDDFQQFYSFLDWSENVNLLVNNLCLVNIPKLEQIPNDTYIGTSKCFNYDTGGNEISAIDCTPSGNVLTPLTELTQDELNAISNDIVIFPNPTKASDQYMVTIRWSGAALNKIFNLQVHNSGGANVFGFTPTIGVNTVSFSLQNQLPGVFVANFTLNTGQVISKNILKW